MSVTSSIPFIDYEEAAKDTHVYRNNLKSAEMKVDVARRHLEKVKQATADCCEQIAAYNEAQHKLARLTTEFPAFAKTEISPEISTSLAAISELFTRLHTLRFTLMEEVRSGIFTPTDDFVSVQAKKAKDHKERVRLTTSELDIAYDRHGAFTKSQHDKKPDLYMDVASRMWQLKEMEVVESLEYVDDVNKLGKAQQSLAFDSLNNYLNSQLRYFKGGAALIENLQSEISSLQQVSKTVKDKQDQDLKAAEQQLTKVRTHALNRIKRQKCRVEGTVTRFETTDITICGELFKKETNKDGKEIWPRRYFTLENGTLVYRVRPKFILPGTKEGKQDFSRQRSTSVLKKTPAAALAAQVTQTTASSTTTTTTTTAPEDDDGTPPASPPPSRRPISESFGDYSVTSTSPLAVTPTATPSSPIQTSAIAEEPNDIEPIEGATPLSSSSSTSFTLSSSSSPSASAVAFSSAANSNKKLSASRSDSSVIINNTNNNNNVREKRAYSRNDSITDAPVFSFDLYDGPSILPTAGPAPLSISASALSSSTSTSSAPVTPTLPNSGSASVASSSATISSVPTTATTTPTTTTTTTTTTTPTTTATSSSSSATTTTTTTQAAVTILGGIPTTFAAAQPPVDIDNPILISNMSLCSIRPFVHKERMHTFEIITPSEKSVLQADSEDEMAEWLAILQNAIAASLEITETPASAQKDTSANKALVQQIKSVPGNGVCADCTRADPDWASINLGVLICIDCSGVHRRLGVHITKVRSLALDKWSPGLLRMMAAVGNLVSNEIYEGLLKEKLPQSSLTRPTNADTPTSVREEFIRAKYEQKLFVSKDISTTSALTSTVSTQQEIDEALIEATKSNDLKKCVHLLALNGNTNYISSVSKASSIHTAASQNNTVLAHLFVQNGADIRLEDDSGATPLKLMTALQEYAPELDKSMDKTNEKTAAAITFAGYLKKQGSNRKWQKRYLVLRDSILYFFKSSKDIKDSSKADWHTKASRKVIVPSYEVSVAEDAGVPFAFKLTHAGMRTYYFAAGNALDMEAWMKALTLATTADNVSTTPQPRPSLTDADSDDSDHEDK